MSRILSTSLLVVALVPTINLTVPTRYLHSHTGIIDRRDFEGAVELLVAVMERLDAQTVAELSSFTQGDR